MGQAGQHTLIVDERTAYQVVTEAVMQRSGRRVTVAKDYDEAVAVLRSSLHPIVVHTNSAVIIPGEGYGSMLFALLAHHDFAATHAFVVSSALDEEDVDAMRAQIAATGVGYVGWLRLPAKVSRIIQAQEAAEAWLAARDGQAAV